MRYKYGMLQRSNRMYPVHVTGVLLLFLCASALLLAGCASSAPVVLQGTVIDAYTGQPVTAAQVRVNETMLGTGGDGSYMTDRWEPEDTLEVSAPGYATTQVPLASYRQPASPTPVTVTLETPLRPNTLNGVVTGAYTNEPVAGALVTVISDVSGAATSPVTSTAAISATTDERGSYRLEGLPETYTLLVGAVDYAPAEVPVQRATVQDIELRPNVLAGKVTDRYSGEPIVDAKVSVSSVSVRTDATGAYRVRGIPSTAQQVHIEAEGYATTSQPLERTTRLNAVLRPNVLETTLHNAESGEPIGFATVIATETQTSTAVASVRIDNSADGSIELPGLPETGYIQVLAPGYHKEVFEIKPGNIPARIDMEPFEARALYIKTTTAAYLPERMEKFFNLIDETELNALVIDLKSDNLYDLGLIYYESQVPIIQELGTSADLMDIRGLLAEAKRRDIYTIARIHVFAHDNLLAETKPEWAAQNIKGCEPNETRKCNGNVFYADWDIAWLDPWNREVWDYNIQLGLEAVQLGFDEIQFDYIRFPNDARDIEYMRLSKPIDWRNNPEPMYRNIATFMEQSHKAFNDVGAFFSVDIFGYAIWAPQPNIGQRADYMAPHADYIYPMVYPSHFWSNELGFENAAAHPYEIIYESLNNGQEMVGDKRAKMRPWLQDFTLLWVPEHLLVRYDVPEVRAQIRAVEESPYGYGWAVWDPDNEYTIGAFYPEADGAE